MRLRKYLTQKITLTINKTAVRSDSSSIVQMAQMTPQKLTGHKIIVRFCVRLVDLKSVYLHITFLKKTRKLLLLFNR